MIIKTIEKMQPTKPKSQKKRITLTVQVASANVIVLNVWRDKKLVGRYAINRDTYEFKLQDTYGDWLDRKLSNLFGVSGVNSWYYSFSHSDYAFDSQTDETMIKEFLDQAGDDHYSCILNKIESMEREYSFLKRERAEDRRVERVRAMMKKIPEAPGDLNEWIRKVATNNIQYAFFHENKKDLVCSQCGHQFKRLKNHKDNLEIQCPSCATDLMVKIRKKNIYLKTQALILQPIDNEISVARHFDVNFHWNKEIGHDIEVEEGIRVILFKNHPKYIFDFYYRQYGGFDNRSNPRNKTTSNSYLYPGVICEALKDTEYERWGNIFKQLSAAGQCIYYNRLMAGTSDKRIVATVEYLFKGRFYKLLKETAGGVSYIGSRYSGPLNTDGKCIEEVFRIKDMQKINRIRALNGGEDILEWIRYSDKHGVKIPQETLEWLQKNRLCVSELREILDFMSLQKIQNYLMRQQAESYKTTDIKRVLNQWKDYLSMCRKLKKKMDDEMVYKPRDLKRRHNEAVVEIESRQAQIHADELADRFKGTEEILAEIKDKYEYSNEDFTIVMPLRLIEVVTDGRVLHHCAGSSDRYFDRIGQRETYIGFLRRTSEEDTPYYTIEFEPGGTIRQHRSYLDEEPDLELIKPFLREWQKEVKKRLTKEDKALADKSKVKREENIQELIKKNNTRVLKALEEDFMEAM